MHYQQLYDCSAYSGRHIIKQKSLPTECLLQNSSEHQQRKHIKKYVCQAVSVVHEHIRNNLRGYVVGRGKIVQTQIATEVKVTYVICCCRNYPNYKICQYQMFSNR